MKRKLFVYKGPIMVDDNCVKTDWSRDVSALDKKDAYNNFVMIAKYFLEEVADIPMNSKVTLPGSLIEVRL